MAAEPDLPTAAGKAYTNLLPLWGGGVGTLKPALASFVQGALVTFGDTFPDQQVNGRPVANWLTVIAALSDRMGPVVSFSEFLIAVQYVYRVCWMAFQLEIQGLITPQQATLGPGSILVQYNANF